MGRLHFFEIHEQVWCPLAVKIGVRDALYTMWKLFFWKNTIPHILDLIQKSEVPHIVDLCSGNGGPMPLIVNELTGKNMEINVTLTDMFPCQNWQNPIQHMPNLEYNEQSINAKNVPKDIGGCRTLFEAFHHFKPDDAIHLLRDAVQSNQPIAVFEFQRPSLFHSMTVYPINIALSSAWLQLFHTPFTWTKLLLTIIPIVPFVLLVDGITSVLRTYSTEELVEVATKAGCDGYRWEVRQSNDEGWGLMTCLIGWPDENDGVHVIEYE